MRVCVRVFTVSSTFTFSVRSHTTGCVPSLQGESEWQCQQDVSAKPGCDLWAKSGQTQGRRSRVGSGLGKGMGGEGRGGEERGGEGRRGEGRGGEGRGGEERRGEGRRGEGRRGEGRGGEERRGEGRRGEGRRGKGRGGEGRGGEEREGEGRRGKGGGGRRGKGRRRVGEETGESGEEGEAKGGEKGRKGEERGREGEKGETVLVLVLTIQRATVVKDAVTVQQASLWVRVRAGTQVCVRFCCCVLSVLVRDLTMQTQHITSCRHPTGQPKHHTWTSLLLPLFLCAQETCQQQRLPVPCH